MLGTQIKIRRLVLGINQPELARRLGISVTTLSNWEVGHTSPKVSWLPHLAEALRTDIGFLLSVDTEQAIRDHDVAHREQ